MRKIEILGELPAGQYYIGDPCYVFDEDWDEFLAALHNAQGDGDAAVFEYQGRKCFVSSTNTGDGCYSDQHGIQYPVDAGMIGVIPIEVIGAAAGWGFDKPFKVGAQPGRWKRSKNIKIGTKIIRT